MADSERPEGKPAAKEQPKLSHELLSGLSPEEFDAQAQELANIESMTPAARARLRHSLIERLKTPVDRPSWGPDWVRHGERVAAKSSRKSRNGGFLGLFRRKDEKPDEDAEIGTTALNEEDKSDTAIISRNMEKSRQVSHYKPLYTVATVLAVFVLLIAMFVDYHIIREVWTRALSNEFMVVPESLRSSVVFKSLQVIFAVLIVHFMLKITGAYGRNAMIATAFVLALVMIGGLGYLVAYNNMAGGTSVTQEQRTVGLPQNNSIDTLLNTGGGVQNAAMTTAVPAVKDDSKEFSLGLPRLSAESLAAADSWFWLAFASVVFFIVTTVAALYMQTAENNVRNFHIAKDYSQRRKHFTQLHMLELAEYKGGR
jgi:hypothetical protein